MNPLPPLRRLFFGGLFALLFLFGGEVFLRVLGFQYQRSLSYMQFNFPNPRELHQIFEPDPVLLWRMRPGFNFGQGFPPLNGEGFRGPAFIRKKAGRIFRIACLGDSVTFGRPEAEYPGLMAKRLSGRLPRPVEALNFGVPGYSSWQGRQLLGSVLRDYHPDLVILLFGWNDHWRARGFPDKMQIPAPQPGRLLSTLRRLRLYQLLNRLAVLAREKISPPSPLLRVSPDDYRENLRAMIRACRRQGVRAILATAPSGLGLAPLPDFFTYLEFVGAPEDVGTLHREYNQIVRNLAAEEAVPLADLDRFFVERGLPNFFDQPDKDIIHPNTAGYQLMAEALAGIVESEIGKP